MSWKKRKLGEFLTNRELRFKPKDKAIEGLKRIEKIDFSGIIYLSDKPSNTDMILVKKGDLVISGINVEKGAMSVYQGSEDVTATIHYSSYSYDEKKIDIEFLKMFLKSQDFIEALKEQVPGGIKTEIKPKHLLPLEVYIPTTLSEQRNVVNLFNNKNLTNIKVSSELDRQLDLIKQLRQSFLREAMQGKLTEEWRKQNPNTEPASALLQRIKKEKDKLIKEGKLKKKKPLPPIKDDEIPFQIPETWVRCRLGEVIDLISGQHIEEKDYNINEEGYPYLTGPSDFGKIYPTITRWTTKPKVFAIKNDVMITVKGAGVGKTNLCNLEQLVISRQLMAIRPLVISNDFIHYFLVNSFELIQSDMKGTGIPGISRENILFKTVAIPPLSEQKKIVESLDSLMKYCNDLELSIKQSKEQNEKLLQVVLKEALEVE